MFAKQATMLLEFAARLCKSDTTGNVLKNFSNELNKIDPNYFRVLPSSCVKNVVKQNNQFVLPNMGNTTGKTLLWALIDMIRNGLAHQYQQIIVELKDNKRFYVSLARGADFQRYLSMAMQSRPADHLDGKFDVSGDLKIIIYPDILFLDFKKAINDSNLLNKGLSFTPLVRKHEPNFYDFDTISLENSLNTGKHKKP